MGNQQQGGVLRFGCTLQFPGSFNTLLFGVWSWTNSNSITEDLLEMQNLCQPTGQGLHFKDTTHCPGDVQTL